MLTMQQPLGQGKQRRQRITQFVGEHRQKLVLGTGRLLEFLIGRGECPGAFFDLPFECVKHASLELGTCRAIHRR